MQKILLFVCYFFAFGSINGQEWIWVHDAEKFNPSGVEISDWHYDFQFIDWEQDGDLEFIVRNLEKLDMYNYNSDLRKWFKSNINLPDLKPITFLTHPDPHYTRVNFVIHDIDNDDDYDIITDSLYVYKNEGDNLVPAWRVIPDYFEGLIEKEIIYEDSVYFNANPQFVDFDNDGLMDIFCFNSANYYNSYPYYRLYMNNGSSFEIHPMMDELSRTWRNLGIPYFLDINNDNAIDFLEYFVGSPSWEPCWAHGFRTLSINQNLPDSLAWFHSPIQSIFEAEAFEERRYRFFSPSVQFYDIDRDTDLDVIQTTANRHIRADKNRTFYNGHLGNFDNISFWGRLNVDSFAQPFLFETLPSIPPILLITENYVSWIFQMDMFTAEFSRHRVFDDWDNLNHDSKYVNNWYHSKYAEKEEHGKGIWDRHYNLYKCFPDVNGNGRYDMVSSYMLGVGTTFLDAKYRIECYYNISEPENPVWEQDTTYLAFFNESPEQFANAFLVNLDSDSGKEIFLKKGEFYTCYKNYGTVESPDWREESFLTSGIDSLNRYHQTFADLDRDGDSDLIFGNYDGTLSFFENRSDSSDFLWAHLPHVFEDIRVDSCAAPAFGDMDSDGDLDLILGDKKGFLYYYINESTVSVDRDQNLFQPSTITLLNNYPNPFNPTTTISFNLQAKEKVSLKIYDISGRLVKELVTGSVLPEGDHDIIWNGTDNLNQPVASGVYIYRLETANKIENQKCTLLR